MEDRIAHQYLAVSLIRIYGAVLGIVIALLAGCATGYQREGFAGGYSERQIGENTFQVLFRGNSYVAKERAADFSFCGRRKSHSNTVTNILSSWM